MIRLLELRGCAVSDDKINQFAMTKPPWPHSSKRELSEVYQPAPKRALTLATSLLANP